MKVGVFIPHNNREHEHALLSFGEGLRVLGVDVELYDVQNYQPVDVAVVFGVGKKSVPDSFFRGKVIHEQLLLGKEVIVIEKGFVRRDEYYMVGRGGGINGRAMFNNAMMKSDRWDMLGVSLQPERYPNDDSHIVVCGQVPWDASVQHTNHVQWCASIISTIRKLTTRKIVWRPHPLAVGSYPFMLGAEQSTHDTLAEDLYGALACITYNSNSGVEALISGVPVFAFDHGSMVYNVANTDIMLLNMPYFPNEQMLRQWAYNLAYTQWTTDEMKHGMPWLHLMSGITMVEGVI